MTAVFADTSFFVGFINSSDGCHVATRQYMESLEGPILTSQRVLAELGNFLSRGSSRVLVAPFAQSIELDPRLNIVQANSENFHAGMRAYSERRDKQWSLVDCVSFNVMSEHSVFEALTKDRNFTQAGFVALLRDE